MNVDRISVCVIKSPGQTSSPNPIEAKERCVPNLNKVYSDHGGEEMGLRMPPTWGTTLLTISPQANLLEQRPEASQNYPETTESPFEPLCDLNSPITHDPRIDDPEEEQIMVEDEPSQGRKAMEFTIG